jgi:peptide/nickel transport system substrate-binding protein
VLLAGAALVLGPLSSASARTHAGPRYGGTLVVGQFRGDPGTLDPTLTVQWIGLLGSMCQELYDYDDKLRLTPVLAAAVPVLSKDKLSYTVVLRKGVLFNDGTPFNAQAVVTTYQRYVTYPGSVRKSRFAGVDSVTASGPYTVVYHLTQRDSTFTGNMRVLSPTALARLGDDFGARPVCVGPFMFDHRVVGDQITLVKSPWYYDQEHVYMDKIVYKPMTNGAAAAAALKAGDIQALDNVSTTELAGIRQNPGLRVIESPGGIGWSGIRINIGNRNGAGKPPYTNVGTPLASSPKLRQGFEEAIDRSTLNRVAFDGQNQVTCTPIPPANSAWYEVTKVPCTPYDPKHARKLVAEAGFPNPTVRLLVPNTTEFSLAAQVIQAQERAVGINVVIDSAESATIEARLLSGDFDTALFTGTGPVDPDPSAVVELRRFGTSGDSNSMGYSSPRIDLILANGLKATDPKARATLYRAAQQIIANDRPVIVLWTVNLHGAITSNLIGVRMTPNRMIVANARFR